MMDIVLPKNNEMEFIEIASRLGIRKLYFLYNFGEYSQETGKNLESMEKQNKVHIEVGLIVNQKNMGKALQHSKILAAKSSDSDRMLIESKKINIIYGLEESHKKDRMHQRASGLNHIICELANKNNVAVGFSYGSLFNRNPIISSQIIGRMMQNITLCRKYKVKTITASFSQNPYGLRARHDISRLFAMLGMDNKNIRESSSQGL
ncbi:hypothetical protein J4204_00290 [Candidatus Woesearchaeota archaeon]|nr:hypothetical protein [Candidatus Woesearchaeota archaeon]